MQNQQSILQCPYCGHQFNEQRRKPMILCMSQHTSCQQCVEKMFAKKNKEELIDCPFRCGKIHYGSIQPFRYMKQIIETKLSLKKFGSTLKKQKVSLDTQKQKMIELLQKQREKNEWLIQLNSKRQNNIISESNKIVKELLMTQLGRMEKNFTKTLRQMKTMNDKEMLKMFENKLNEYQQKSIKNYKLIQEESRVKMVKLQKKMDQQMAIIKKVNESLYPLQKIQKNIVKSIQQQDFYIKTMKSLESDSVKMKQQLMSIDEALKQLKIQKKSIKEEEKKVANQGKIQDNPEKIQYIPQVKVEKKLEAKRLSEPVVYKQMMGFMKKNVYNPVYEAKKQQIPNKKINSVNIAEKLKTEPNQPLNSRPSSSKKNTENINSMRNTTGPVKMQPNSLFMDDNQQNGSRTQRTYTYFKQSDKNKILCKSYKDLGNVSLIEQKTAQQKKVESILKKIEPIFGRYKVSTKAQIWKTKIDNYIHLSEEQIIDKLLKQATA